MKIHLYDYLNKNKKALVDGSAFTNAGIDHSIDDYSSCRLETLSFQSGFNDKLAPFDNIYVEDDNGKIIFGGIVTGYTTSPLTLNISAIDHRWIFSRLLLDEPVSLTNTDNILDAVDALINQAKAKRDINIIFDREGSAVNSDTHADLLFNVGEDIAGCMQKIIQTTYSRWAMRYEKQGNDIIGYLVVRSVKGVTPQGVGISRTRDLSEDGTQVTLKYHESDQGNNIQDFTFNIDGLNFNSKTKVGIKIGDESQYVEVDPAGDAALYASIFGTTEAFVTDYKATSVETAKIIGEINQNLFRQDYDLLLAPTFDTYLKCGDRVNVDVKTNLTAAVLACRIDSMSYTRKAGYFEIRMLANSMSPQKRDGSAGLVQIIGTMNQKLNDLDQSYLSSTA